MQDAGKSPVHCHAQQAISEALSHTVLQGKAMDDTKLRLHQVRAAAVPEALAINSMYCRHDNAAWQKIL